MFEIIIKNQQTARSHFMEDYEDEPRWRYYLYVLGPKTNKKIKQNKTSKAT